MSRLCFDFNTLENAAHGLADQLRMLAEENASKGDIYGVHYAVTQMNAIRRMTHNIKRRFGA